MRLFLILILFPIMMTGCATYGSYEISRPTIGDKSGRYKYKRISWWEQKINLNGIDLFVEPHNDWMVWEIFTVTIVPVWIFTDESASGKEKAFMLDLDFFPHDDGFSFDPMKVSLQIDEVGDIKPIRVKGPMPKYHRGAYSFGTENELVARGHVICGGGISDANQETHILLKKESLWTCLQLVFDIPIPSPKHNIKLNIYGLQKDNQPVEIPSIQFERLEEKRGDSIP
jgi:hypothetical protein